MTVISTQWCGLWFRCLTLPRRLELEQGQGSVVPGIMSSTREARRREGLLQTQVVAFCERGAFLKTSRNSKVTQFKTNFPAETKAESGERVLGAQQSAHIVVLLFTVLAFSLFCREVLSQINCTYIRTIVLTPSSLIFIPGSLSLIHIFSLALTLATPFKSARMVLL